MTEQPAGFFREISAAALAHSDVATGTMMGFPCLRISARSSPPASTAPATSSSSSPGTASSSSSRQARASRSPPRAGPSANGS